MSFCLQHTSIKHIPEGLVQGLEGCASLTLDLRMNALQTLSPQSIRNNNSLSATSTRHITGEQQQLHIRMLTPPPLSACVWIDTDVLS